METNRLILIVLSVALLLLGTAYAIGTLNPTQDDQGRWLYTAEFTYRANNPLYGEGYLTELDVSNFQKQQLLSLYAVPLWVWPGVENEYNQKIYVVCDGVQVFQGEDQVKALENSYGEGEITLKNLPSGTYCILTMEMYKMEDNMKKDTETETFTVP